MDEGESLPLSWNDELTDKEVYFIGKIVAHWGAIEYEVFSQTLLSFENEIGDVSELPSAMRSVRFSNVLDLWEKRVVSMQPADRRQVLEEQLEEINRLMDMRNALVHSMLLWSPQDIGVITASRVRNKEYISVKFTSDDLADFYQRLSRVNFNIRCPGSLEELAEQRLSQGGYISRRGIAMLSGHEIVSEWPEIANLKSDNEDE